MAKAKDDMVSLSDLEQFDTADGSMEGRVEKLELFMKRFDGSNMNLTDRQVVYHAAFMAVLQGMIQFMPNLLRKPDALYEFLRDAKNAAEFAVVVYDGGTKADFTGLHSTRYGKRRDD